MSEETDKINDNLSNLVNNAHKSIEEQAAERRKQIEEKLNPNPAQKELTSDKNVIPAEEKLPPRTEEHLLEAKRLHELLQSPSKNETESNTETQIKNEIVSTVPEISIKLEASQPDPDIEEIAQKEIKLTDIKLTDIKLTDIELEQIKIIETVEQEITPAVSTENLPETSDNMNDSVITDFDLHLFKNGTFYKIYEKFGAQICEQGGISGVQFTTWAPNATGISVIGEFNGWQDGVNEMHRINDSGVWSLFIPSLKEGDTYKFSIKSGVDNLQRRKIDPYAFRSEHRPKDASIVHNINKYKWNDNDWVGKRKSHNFKSSPVNIYELHLGSWLKDYDNKEFPNEWGYLSYGQLANKIVDYVKKMGYTHIEVLPVMEHPLDISWGYQVTHYFAPTSRFGLPEDFMYFVDHCHQNGIGVILDWVPAHFPSDDHALADFDGKQIYAYEDWKKGYHKDWNTYVFDYSSPQVQNFLISSALFWLEKYHIDSLRVDAVASMLYLDYSRDHGEWEPNIHGGRENLEAIEFLKHLNDVVHKYYPDTVTIAEESTSWPGVSHSVEEGGLGFDMKWNMGWMNDILLYFSKDPVHRKFHQGKITFSLWYAFSENFLLPISHDEVVHGKKSLLEKMPGDTWQKFANLRLFLGFMFGHPGKKLNFMTTDIAQYNEWNCETSLEWNLLELVEMNKKLNLYMADLNNLYKTHRALYEIDFASDGFQWVDFSDALNSALSFYRISEDKKEIVLFTFNMTPTVRNDYPIGVPEAGYWKEIFNSDAEAYGGSGIGNMGGKQSEPVEHKTWKNSMKVTLPPLAVNIYLWEKPEEKQIIPENAEMSSQIEPGIESVEELYIDADTGGGE